MQDEVRVEADTTNTQLKLKALERKIRGLEQDFNHGPNRKYRWSIWQELKAARATKAQLTGEGTAKL